MKFRTLFYVISVWLLGMGNCGIAYGSVQECVLDETEIDQLFEAATVLPAEEVLLQFEEEVMVLLKGNPTPFPKMTSLQQDKQIGALILCWCLGIIGAHRLFLGGKGELALFYACTVGGCGVIWLADFIILASDGTRRFENNDRFIAW